MFLLNGEEAGSERGHLELSDRAIHYGDGLFETVAYRDGRLEFWHAHMQRLKTGCERLSIPMPDEAALLADARQLLKDQGSSSVLKIIISRGSGGRGYRPPEDGGNPQRILGRYSWPDYPKQNVEQGIQLRVCQTRVSISPALAGLKHLNRLEQVLARSEWSDPDIAEGLMLDPNGNVIEGTMSNLFFVRDGYLHTPDLSNSGVAGIIRGVVLKIAQQLDIPLNCGTFQLSVLESAEEVFITNSLIGLWPVRAIGQQEYAQGAITRQIIAVLDRERCKKGEYETV